MNSVTIVICADFVVFRPLYPAVLLHKLTINPLSPNGVQCQYSPNTIYTLLRD